MQRILLDSWFGLRNTQYAEGVSLQCGGYLEALKNLLMISLLFLPKLCESIQEACEKIS